MTRSRRRNAALSLSLSLLLLAGCEGPRPHSDPIVPIDKVPSAIVEVAKKALPGFTFDVIYETKVNGKDAYEFRGKDKRGKVREVEVSKSGEVLAIE